MARRAGQDLEVVGCAEPLILPRRLPRVVGEAVVGDQQGAGQRLADQPPCDHRHVVEGVEVAGVQPSRELVEVSLRVLRRHLAEGALHGPLQLGPDRLDRIGAFALFADVDAVPVVHGPVLAVEAAVGAGLVGVDRRVVHRVALDEALKRRRVRLHHDLRPDLAGLAVADPRDGGLADGAAARPQLLVRVLVLLQAADVGLVNLDSLIAFKGRQVADGAGLADAVRHEPSRLVADSEGAPELHRGDAVQVDGEFVDRGGPLHERQLGILHDRCGSDREALAAVLAHMRHR